MILNNLEQTIQKLLNDSAANVANQIAAAVRESVVHEFAANVIGNGASTTATEAAPPPKRVGRPPGSGKKAAAAPTARASAPAPTAAAAPAKKHRGRPGKGTSGHVAAVLDFIAKNPGTRPVDILKGLSSSTAAVKVALTKLRAAGSVKMAGQTRKTTYTAVGSGAAPSAPVAPTAAVPTAKAGKRRKRSKVRYVTEGEMQQALGLIRAKPNRTRIQLQQELGFDKSQAKRVFQRLRLNGVVKVKGAKSSATYTIAGSNAAVAPAPVPASPKATKPARKRGRGIRSYTDADLGRVLGSIKATPGLRPKQYLAESKLSGNAFDRLIGKLKETNQIRVHGKGGGTTYTAVGSSSAPTPAAATPKPAKPAGKKGGGSRAFTDADSARVLDLITRNPAWHAGQIREAAKLDVNAFKYVVRRLKESGQVKAHGGGKITTYTVIGSSAAAAPKATKAAATKAAKTRKGPKVSRITEAEVNQVLDVIKARPGLTSVQIQKEARIDSKQAARVFQKLRDGGGVNVKGKRSAATYTVA